jgi:hypothetical protein
MLALTLVALTALHADPDDVPPSPRLSADAAAAWRRAEARGEWGLGFKFLAAVGAVGIVGTGGTAITFTVKGAINNANGFYGDALQDETNRNFALAGFAAAAGLVLISGVVAFFIDIWAERLTRQAAATP